MSAFVVTGPASHGQKKAGNPTNRLKGPTMRKIKQWIAADILQTKSLATNAAKLLWAVPNGYFTEQYP